MESNIIRKSVKFKNKVENLTSEEVCKIFSGLVYGLCKRWTIRYNIDDLKQIGFIGLIKAYNAYDINKNVLFTTFATLIINSELNQNYRSDKSKHIVVSSLNSTINSDNDEGSEFIELLYDENNYEDVAITNIDYENLRLAINKLDSVDKKIVELSAFQHKTQIEISKILNISYSSISKKYKGALEQIKNIMKGEDNMRESKISKEELLSYIKKCGTSNTSLNDLAQKKGLGVGTIKSYLDVWDIRKYSKDYKGNKIEKAKTKNRTKIKEETSIKETPILRAVTLYKGLIGEYEIKDNCIDLKLETGTLTINKDNINNLVMELQELNKLII